MKHENKQKKNIKKILLCFLVKKVATSLNATPCRNRNKIELLA